MLQPEASWVFPKNIAANTDLSAIALIPPYILIGADEGHAVQLLKPVGEHRFELLDTLVLVKDPKTETDIEDICCHGSICYVIGSHSRKRKKLKSNRSRAENRDRLYQQPQTEPRREALFRIQFDRETERLSLEYETSLQPILQADALLQPFLAIASKENGVDIEGLAIQKDRDRLFIGFRSPIFRGNYVPILSVDAQELIEPDLNFLQLEGRGIRAMCETHHGFLVIGGPADDSEMSYELYFWNGKDMVPGNDVDDVDTLQPLGTIPVPGLTKAEGLAVLSETPDHWQIVVLYDGVTGGQPTVFTVAKSCSASP